MHRQPRGDTITWDTVLAHRPPEARGAVAERFCETRLSPDDVAEVLRDAGDTLYAAAASGEPAWPDRFGGPLAVALLAAEVSALTAHLNSRASAVRSRAVDALLDDFSAVTVGARLGVSRQKVYDISRGTASGPFVEHTPWRQQ